MITPSVGRPSSPVPVVGRIARACCLLLLLMAGMHVSAAKAPPRPTPSCDGPLGQPTLAFPWESQMYVGNADGTCALSVATLLQNHVPAFGTTGSRYRIVWIADNRDERTSPRNPRRYTVRMVEFSVSNGAIVEPRPLPVRELWRDSVSTSESTVYSISLDATAGRVMFARNHAGGTELKVIDLSTCATGACVANTIWNADAGTTYLRAEFGRANDGRIYAAQEYTTGVGRMIFIEGAGTSWVGPGVLVTSTDPAYANSGFSRFLQPSVARLDWDEDGSVDDDMLALLRIVGSENYFDVLRIGPGCTLASNATTSCLSAGSATVEESGVPAGWIPASAEWTPAGKLLRMIDPIDSIYGNDRIETIDPKTRNTWDHDYGMNPAGLKQ